MASDGRIRIDIDMAIDKIMADANKVDKRLQDVGQGTGDQLSEDFDANAEKVSDKSGSTAKKVKNDFSDPVKQSIEGDDSNLSEKVANAKSNLEKLPDETLTELKAEAKDAGITDFDALLEALPEEEITELLAKAEKGEVINYEELLHEIPLKYVTNLELNDNASPSLHNIQDEAEETKTKFTSLKDI
ncbi:hypothetical protein, partial [Weissella thailandensis]|uniref:hypothetical protein n=1 Tax=Weissella thailandensis TaxID=89061 RepID=UPI00356B7718